MQHRPKLRRRLDPDGGRLGRRATSRLAATSVTCAPRARAASAMATPILPVERLPMNRTGSMASRVPPALTTMCRPSRSGSRAGSTVGGRAAGSAARIGRSPIAATTASTIAGSSASRPTPDWPDASCPPRARRSCTRTRPAGARRCRGSPGASTCRRPSPGRRRPARVVARQVAVTSRRTGRGPWPPSQWAVAGATTIASALSATTMWPIRPSGSSAEQVRLDRVPTGSRRQRPDERGRGGA